MVFLNAPLIKVRGQWALHVNYNDYQKAILNILAHKPTRLTGDEVKFARKYFERTIRAFAERFSVKHPAVMKWENKGEDFTQMAWSTEKDIRLFILDELKENASEFRSLYRSLKEIATEEPDPVIIDGENFAA